MKIKTIFVLGVMALASATTFAGSTPKQTVYNFFNAIQRGNIDAALQEVQGTSNLSAEEREQVGALWLLLFGSNALRPQVTDVEDAGYGRKVVYVRLTNPATGDRTTENLNLRKVGGEWKIIFNK